MSDSELIDNPETTHEEKDTSRPRRRKNTEEVKKLSSTLEETASVSPGRGGDDEIYQEETNGKKDQ
jgi:hypothetical protein